ncbi:MAG: hypothetical protein Q9163_005753 [Psora crenata]
MSYQNRPLTSSMRHPSIGGSQSNTGQSPVLLARINEKKAELENLRQLRDLSGGLASQMQALEEKLSTLSDDDGDIEILEDGHHSFHSDAVDVACNDLLDNAASEPQHMALPDRTISPPSPAVEAACQQLSRGTAPRLDPPVHKAMDADTRQIDEETLGLPSEGRDSGDHKNGQKLEADQNNDENGETKDDSFVEQIRTRTPAKRVSRIEDSVEALDALEDEIDKIDEAIPAASSELSPPANTKRLVKTPTEHSYDKSSNSLKANKTPLYPTKHAQATVHARPPPARRSFRPSPGAPKPSNTRLNTAKPNAAPGTLARVVKPAAESGRRHAPSSKRVSSVHKAPFQPAKSTKPPTKSTFELPGEAVARKLKEQREERQRRGEEEQAKQCKSSAKPVRLSQVPDVKLTATTKARLSLAHNMPVHNTRPRAALHTGTTSGVIANKRQSTINVPRRTSTAPCRKTSPSSTNTSLQRVSRLSAGTMLRQLSVSAPAADDVVHQKLTGKDVFDRTRTALSEREKEKKAKEEAAKKARAEAAERGRLASREWADKQRTRKLAAMKVKGDGEANAVALA